MKTQFMERNEHKLLSEFDPTPSGKRAKFELPLGVGFNSRKHFTFQPKADPSYGGRYRSVKCAFIEGDQMKFEETFSKLEKIVDELESGNISLDKAIKKYQEGMSLSKQCLESLNKAEKKVQICLKDKQGKIKIKDFNQDDHAGEN